VILLVWQQFAYDVIHFVLRVHLPPLKHQKKIMCNCIKGLRNSVNSSNGNKLAYRISLVLKCQLRVIRSRSWKSQLRRPLNCIMERLDHWTRRKHNLNNGLLLNEIPVFIRGTLICNFFRYQNLLSQVNIHVILYSNGRLRKTS